MSDIQAALKGVEQQILELQRQYDELVAAEVGSNADDEHDPEGQTLAFERQQLLAVIESAQHKRADILRALDGDERCETCGEPIGAERLEARPYARTCIGCARSAADARRA